LERWIKGSAILGCVGCLVGHLFMFLVGGKTPDQSVHLNLTTTFIIGSDDIVSGIARLNARFQPTLLLVTQGKAGVQAALRGQVSHFPARPVVAVDTTGAGDAFVAGLLAGLAAHGIPDNLAALAPDLALAQTCGALATTAKGAMTALPYRDDLQRSL
ncbi:PfkB family carbohydrate kinase, partial [Klebsiella pneumoniae]|uniref:PfkB family carbohydrate kinase n=1 Tax=Klebsiella pneumoniae TaxID=573 RepID=UPI003F8C5F6D